jgi:ferredoxin
MQPGEIASYIIYSSPAGTTRHAALIIAGALKEMGSPAHLWDLGKRSDCLEAEDHIKDLSKDCCLWIGTPVYAGHAVPSVTGFISRLPEGNGSYAVPFATWGMVTSGLALHEMGAMLSEKGYGVLGAAKIGAVHSMMLQCKNPLGVGHPDAHDDRLMKDLVEAVSSKIQSGSPQPLSLQQLNYQSPKAQEWLQKMNIEAAKKMLPPLKLVEAKCTRCGICEKECPADAIRLDPYPRFGDACFMCYNCYHLCEEGAIDCDLSPMEKMLKEKSAHNPELPRTQVFF